MARLIKLSDKSASDPPGKPSGAAQKQGAPAPGGLGAIQVTPKALGIVLALLVLAAGLWFTIGRGSGAASTPLIDTTTDSRGPDTTKANGIDTSTDSSGPATTGNGIETSTGR